MAAKINRKGRNKHEQFIRLTRTVTNSSAWNSLSCVSRALLIAIWGRHNGFNNGRIPYSVRDAKSDLHVGTNTAMRAFRQLQDRGFIVLRQRGSFHVKIRQAHEWELTMERCDESPPKWLYKRWPEIRNPVLTAGTDGSNIRNHEASKNPNLEADGSSCRNRFGEIRPMNGSSRGHTYNLPGGGGRAEVDPETRFPKIPPVFDRRE